MVFRQKILEMFSNKSLGIIQGTITWLDVGWVMVLTLAFSLVLADSVV